MDEEWDITDEQLQAIQSVDAGCYDEPVYKGKHSYPLLPKPTIWDWVKSRFSKRARLDYWHYNDKRFRRSLVHLTTKDAVESAVTEAKKTMVHHYRDKNSNDVWYWRQ